MRSDAARNRHRLILAASAIMRSQGGDVPMEAIAEHAGLTRGTLYRNFAHRQEMYQAVLDHDLTQLARQIADESEADPLAFMRRTTEMMMAYQTFLVALSAMKDFDFRTAQDRMAQTIGDAFRSAQQRGCLRDDLTVNDMVMVCRMLASHLHLDDPADRDHTIASRMALMMRGLSPYQVR